MRYKHLERADVDISVLGIGTWAIGGYTLGGRENKDVGEKDAIDAIHTMIDRGVNLIDTAAMYGTGRSEEIVGKAIKGLDRSKVFIATKMGAGPTTLKYKSIPDPQSVKRVVDSSRANIIQELDQSLTRLDMDYIDFYLAHYPDPDTPFEEMMDTLEELRKAGKIRFVGVSNFTQEMIEECLKYGNVEVVQPNFSMVARNDEDLIKWCASKGISTFTYGSLGAGILTGVFRTPPQFGEHDPRSGFYPFFKDPMFSQVMKVLEVMDVISADTGKPLAQIALNWVTQNEYVSNALCGVRNPDEANENCDTFSWMLTNEQIKTINKAISDYLS